MTHDFLEVKNVKYIKICDCMHYYPTNLDTGKTSLN